MIKKLEPRRLYDGYDLVSEKDPELSEVVNKVNEIIETVNGQVDVMESQEKFYKEVCYGIWLSTFRTGDHYEGERATFEKLWEEHKTYRKDIIRKVLDQF